MAIMNLTNTSWYIKDTNCAAGYGRFAVQSTVNAPGVSFDGVGIAIGYSPSSYHGGGDWVGLANNAFAYAAGEPQDLGGVILTIAGGADVANASLIAWLTEHAVQVPSDLTGTKWVLNDSGIIFWPHDSFSINFTSNSSSYYDFSIDPNWEDEIEYSAGLAVYKNGGWIDQAYRIIRITGGSDASNTTLIAWLAANAKQVPSSLAGTKWTININGRPSQLGQFSINFSSNNERFSFFNLQEGGIMYDSTQVYYYSGSND